MVFLVKVFDASVSPPRIVREFSSVASVRNQTGDCVLEVVHTDGYRELAPIAVTEMVELWPITPSDGSDATGVR